MYRKAFLLIGYPCAGKSTIANILVALTGQTGSVKTPLVTISSDNILEGVRSSLNVSGNHEFTYNDLFDAGLYTHCVKMMTKVLNLVSEEMMEYNIIWDQVNHTKDKRTKTINTLKQKGFDEVIAVWVKTSLDVCKSRNSNPDRRGKFIPDEVYSHMENAFTEPTLEEGFDKLIVVENLDIAQPLQNSSLKELLKEI